MLLFLILSFLLLGNWILTEVLVYIPIHFVESLNSIAQIAIVVVLVSFLAWCLGDG